MDSGCSYHMTPHKEFFKDLIIQEQGTVQLGDDRPCKIQGIGTVTFKLKNGSLIDLSNVRYIPELKRNLLSLGTFESSGYHVSLRDGKAKIINGSMVVLTGVRRGNNIYFLEGDAVSNSVNVVEDTSSEAMLWHRRMGHISAQGLVELNKHEVFGNLKDCNVGFCEHCVLGKSHRVKFSRSTKFTKGILDYIHADLWGPAKVISLGGARYFLSLIDDYSRRVWVFVLKSKDETFDKFKEWRALVENQTEKKIKKLRTDNGLEFCNHLFDQYCKKHGIARHLTNVGTPQQNGLVERMNRTLLNKVRCMLFGSGLPKKFWAEALSTAAYLVNMSPSSAIDMETPMERWSGEKPDYNRLRVFGTIAYAHINQGKLEPRAQKCILLGYTTGVKGYRLWRLEEGSPKVINSRDVVEFREDKTYRDVMGDKTSGDAQKNNSENRIQIEVEAPASEKKAGDERTSQPETSSSACDSDNYSIARDRTRRQIIKPSRYRSVADLSAFVFSVAEQESIYEPLSFDDALNSPDKSKWLSAMKDEMDSLYKNKTWILVDKPKEQKLVDCKWIFKVKEGMPGEAPRFKARLVAKGFTQRAGVDYQEIFSPVVKHTSIRVMLSLTAVHNFELEQLDVKTTFLHGNLEENIYMRQPPGFEVEGQDDKVCLLKKSLYGLKQSPRQWYKRFDDYVVSHGFSRCSYDCCVYYKEYSEREYVYLLLYVDDMLLACKDKAQVEATKKLLMCEFDMKELGEAKKILGMEIHRNRESGILRLTQESYVKKVLNNFFMEQSKSVQTPLAMHFKLSNKDSPQNDEEAKNMASVPYASAVGSLMYLMVCTRPDIGYAVSVVSRFLSNPGKLHWEGVKWIMRYLNGTRSLGIVFGKSERQDQVVQGFVDSDFAKDRDRGRSITGYVFKVLGGSVSWKASLQHVVALSTTEAEFIALTEAVKEALWLKGLISELGIVVDTAMVKCDNLGAIQLSKHQVFHERSKHISVKLHFIRDVINSKEVTVEYVDTEENAADMLTKSLPGPKFVSFLQELNVG
ncbi:putative RNA-directed DNA polymerase [Helianthus annuus]|nr:putative RNA-directed DNA polymerase [Helianthus annuus]KAJ0505487.1 putative RNA-directed DNA polymerase [Helianthus annuus]KAJ0866746.1 putative RNA-directed DNA polymerase [Helianthus annuus]